MRPALRWGLVLSSLASAVALWPRTAPPPPAIVAAVEPGALPPQLSPASRDERVAALRLPGPLQIDPAFADPFAPAAAPPPPAADPPPPQAPRQASPEPTVPSAPPMNWRYFGRLVAPDGRELVMLARGELSVAVQAGTVLDDGYVVKSVSPEAIRLNYPPLDLDMELTLPARGSTP